MYAPHSSLACALLDGPLERTRQGVLDVDGTRVTPDDWRVATLQPLREEHVAIAGNLCLNPIAARKANLIRSAIVERQEHPAFIEAGLPFDWTTPELRVAAFPSRPMAAAGLATRSSASGGPTRRSARRRSPSLPKSRRRRSRAYSTSGLVPPHPRRRAGGQQAQPPAHHPHPAGAHPSAGTAAKAGSRLGGDGRIVRWCGRARPDGAGKAVPQAVDAFGGSQPVSVLFSAVLAMLAGLAAARSIVAHELVEPSPRFLVLRG